MRTSASILVAVLLATLVPTGAALPTPGLFCDPSDLALGRLFPEAMQTNDYVGYEEALCGLDKLQASHPDWIRRDVVAQSVGWPHVAGGHDQFEVFVVRVSNYAGELPVEDKIRLVFQLSIHGNEKGGREGGLRVIEDLVRDMGMAKENPELRGYLDYMELLFVFPNPDGWRHEEVEYRHADACYVSLTCRRGETGVETQNFVRVNGNGVDVNREWPTAGWVRERYTPMSEPEAIGLVNYLKNETNVRYATDIHGMLNPADGNAFAALGCLSGGEGQGGMDPTCFQSAVTGASGHFVLTMLPAGRQSPQEMLANTALAELVKERLNGNPVYAEWSNLPSALGVWGGEMNDWGTVWDTIGYTDSGFTSDWYAQDQGLNAYGVDFELSYNHITFDNYYPGLAQRMNAYHVENVRDIVRAFMDHAALDIRASIETHGARTAFLENPTVVTNADAMGVSGWAEENPHDDAFDTANRVFRASPNDYFTDLQPFVRDGDRPGILDALKPGELVARLGGYDNLVVAGSAYKSIQNHAPAKAAIKAWVEQGGNLFASDEALQLLADLGIVAADDVDVYYAYAGHTNFVDKSHELASGVRGLARETYEPVPLGFGIDGFNAPVWFVDASAFEGEVVGVAGEGQGATPNAAKVSFGRVALGEGRVTFLGALLPDPTVQDYTPYGVESYATTYTGNQLLRSALGWEEVYEAPPLAVEELGKARALPAGSVEPATGGETRVPAAPLAALLVGLAAVALLRRRG